MVKQINGEDIFVVWHFGSCCLASKDRPHPVVQQQQQNTVVVCVQVRQGVVMILLLMMMFQINKMFLNTLECDNCTKLISINQSINILVYEKN